ncbi:hypothetical protein POJ06DRAFT_97588 [Lipomyces tetrasporus]|uniref:Cora-domain-containing protein n=1 Tax=Lipomyces tetrasporus TaxID=54092 RepID=A0AAD7QU02_9ASCO|nr:uncharacterized protein POJ06DRAFT_97588 [Lipomyces tetrasporus]KAJ8101473.1 hypothetical protein POJ06DRAFT_97588 [Lipomyces tetrasporus]
MEASRTNSPLNSAVNSSSELYDHRNQPETLPIRVSFSDGTQTTGNAPLGVHVSSGSMGSATARPNLSTTTAPELAIYDQQSDYEGEAEDEGTLHRTTSRRRSSLSRIRTGGSVVINLGDGTVPSTVSSADGTNPFEYGSSPTASTVHRHHRQTAFNPNTPGSNAGGRAKGTRRPSNEVHSRLPIVSDGAHAIAGLPPARARAASSVSGHEGAVEKAIAFAKEQDSASRASYSDSDESVRSRVNSEDETEEDVCFPMHLEHQRINGIDFDEIEEFAAAQRLEQWYPSMTRRADNDLGSQYGRRLTFSVGTGRTADRPTAGAGAPKLATVINVSATADEDEKPRILSTDGDEIDDLKSKTLPPDVAARLAAADDRFSLFCSESEETIHAPEICLLTGPGQTFTQLFDKANGTWWLDCLDPTDAEMKMLAKAFGIHPLTTEDIRVQETREKVELFRSYYFVCFRTFEHDKASEEFLEPLNMYMVVFREGILSFHFSPFQHTANVRRRIRQLRDYVTVSADWICYALIDDITDGFAPVLHEIEQEADGIEDSVFVARESDFGDMLKRIGEARKTVMTLMRLLSGKADVIKMFAKRCNEQWDVAPKGEIGLYLGDIQDHIVTMYQNLSAYEKILSRSHANYLAQIQVESVHSNNRVTKMLSKVTLIGTILVPLNLITGLFGMNVKVPGNGVDNLKWFFGIVGVIFFIVISAFYLARLWLGSIERQEKRLD